MSTSLHFDPDMFAKGMADELIVSSWSSTQRNIQQKCKGEKKKEKEGGGQSLQSEQSAVY